MSHLPQQQGLLASLYSAALEPDGWSPALARVAQRVGAQGFLVPESR